MIYMMASAFMMTTLSSCNIYKKEKQATKKDVFTAKGTKLYLNGKPFHGIGFDKFDLAMQIMAEYMPDVFTAFSEGFRRSAAVEALTQLNEMGFKVIRVWGGPMSKIQMQKSYYNEEKKELYYQALDDMLTLCQEFNIKVIFSVGWGWQTFDDLAGEKAGTLVRDPESSSRKMFNDYLEDIINRYKKYPSVVMWEIGNEMSLKSDINNAQYWKSEELASYYADTANRIRKADPLRMIGTGDNDRGAAWRNYQFAKNGISTSIPDTFNNHTEWYKLMYAMEKGAPDAISIHYYRRNTEEEKISNPFSVADYMKIAEAVGKPLYIGESGAPCNEKFSYENRKRIAKENLNEFVSAKVSLAMVWSYHIDRWQGTDVWDIRKGKDDELLQMTMDANKQLEMISD